MDFPEFTPPGLLAGPAEFARIRILMREHAVVEELADFIRRLADHELGEPVAAREMTGFRLLEVSRTVLRRVINCGLAYQIFGDERHARRAIADVRAAAEFTDWNPSHFLDTAEMCCAFALALDWLHEALSPEARARLEDALIRLGLEPGLANPDAVFITITNNWNAVCNGGLAMGALAVRHRRPDLAEKLVGRCIGKLPLHGANYAPEGAFIEGPNYWGYGTAYHVLAVESLLRATGSAHGLDALPGFRESAAYLGHITGPSGKFYSYSDSGERRVPSAELFWFGRHYDDPAATRGELDLLIGLIKGGPAAMRTRFFALSILWLNPDHMRAGGAAPLAWSGDGPNPVACWRTGWSAEAVWFACKGGCATLSHGHLDAGSFVLEAGGVRWVIDPGMEDYHRLESMGVDLWHKDRWTLFRLGAEGHSIPRIDGIAPDVNGRCARLAWTTEPQPEVVFDLAPLYPGTVSGLVRTMGAAPAGRTKWRDDVTGLAAGKVYRFTWVTEADVRLTADGAELTQDGRVLMIRTRCALPVEGRVLDGGTLLKAADTPRPRVKRLEFAVISEGGGFSFEAEAGLA